MKNEIKVLYVDHTSRNADPFEIRIEYENNMVNVFCISHGAFAGSVFRYNKLNLIIEDDHDTGTGKHIVKTLIEQYAFSGYHKSIDLDKFLQQSEHRALNYYSNGKQRKITKRKEAQVESIKDLVKKVIEECKGRNRYEENEVNEGLIACL